MADARPQLRARSATEIVDAAFQLFRRDPLTYLLVAALGYVPVLITQLLVVGPAAQVEELARLTPGHTLVMMLGYWTSLSLMSAVLVRLSAEDYLGHGIDPRAAAWEAFGRLPTVMFGLLLKYIMMFLGFLLFFVGLFWMIARYFAVTPAIVLEGQGVFGALSRSVALSRGQKLHILGTSLLAFLIFFVIYIGVSIVSAMTGSTVLMMVLSTVASIVAYPLFAMTEMLLYYDTRVRNEGYDIELMAEGLGTEAAR